MSDDDVPRDTPPTGPTENADTLSVELSTWLTLEEAATLIGCSTRTVERLARAGKLEQRLRRQARGHDVVVYYPDDVAARAAERRPVRPAPFLVPGSANGNGTERGQAVSTRLEPSLPVGDDPLRLLFAAALRAVLAPTTSPTPPTVSATVSEKLFLTVKEAAALTGLPPIELRRAIASGELPARKTGRGGWRIRRRDLERL